MRRREFISLLGGSVAWPLAARAQQQKLSRIGVLTGIAANDAETKARFAAFSQELQRLGWVEGRDVQFDIRGGAGLTLLTEATPYEASSNRIDHNGKDNRHRPRALHRSPCPRVKVSQSAITFRLAPEMIFEAAGLWNNPV